MYGTMIAEKRSVRPSLSLQTLMNLSERQRKRFMFGEWVEEVEGALWKSSLIDRTRLLRMSVKSVCTVIGVDPAVSSNNSSDYTGIVVCSLGDDGHFYVTGDFSMQGKPVEWCRKIVEIFHKLVYEFKVSLVVV